MVYRVLRVENGIAKALGVVMPIALRRNITAARMSTLFISG
jgi:hypothetical protein